MKKIILTFLVALFTLSAAAQSDFEIAQSFMSKKGVKLVDNPSARTRSTDIPYSIFNGSEDKGFCIVVNGEVVGYDTNNTVDEDNMSCCLKELLTMYSESIPKRKTRGNDPSWFTPRNVTPIEPLIKTHWGQGSPYNDLLEQKSGICTVVAWCQLMHYFRVPQTYEEVTINDSTVLPITYFDHDLMLDKYTKGNYTEEEAYEVAKLYYYQMYLFNDTPNINGACDKLWYRYGMELRDFIGELINGSYNENFFINFNKQRDELLEQGIPFWGCNDNHAFVVDGRDSEGRYHVNLGWDGGADGYYAFPDTRDEYDLKEQKYAGKYPTYIIPTAFEWSYSGTSSISPIFTTHVVDGSVYNLQCRKVGNSLEGLPKGIYIQNKKKYLIK